MTRTIESVGRHARCTANGNVVWDEDVRHPDVLDALEARLRITVGEDADRLLDFLPPAHRDLKQAERRILQLVRHHGGTAAAESSWFDILLGAVSQSLLFRNRSLPELMHGTMVGEQQVEVPFEAWAGAGALVACSTDSGTDMHLAVGAPVAHNDEAVRANTIRLGPLDGLRGLDASNAPDLLHFIGLSRIELSWHANGPVQDRLLGYLRIALQFAADPLTDVRLLASWVDAEHRLDLDGWLLTVASLNAAGDDAPVAAAAVDTSHLQAQSWDDLVLPQLTAAGVTTLHLRGRGPRDDEFLLRVQEAQESLRATIDAIDDAGAPSLEVVEPFITREGITIGVSGDADPIPYAQLSARWIGTPTIADATGWARSVVPGSTAVVVHMTLENRAHARAFSTGLILHVARRLKAPSLAGRTGHLRGFSRRLPPPALEGRALDNLEHARARQADRMAEIGAVVDEATATVLTRPFEQDAAAAERYLERVKRDRPVRWAQTTGAFVAAFLVVSTVISAAADAGDLKGEELLRGVASTVVPALVIGFAFAAYWWYVNRAEATSSEPDDGVVRSAGED